MEFTNEFRQARPVQAMKRHVPVFQAASCHGKGMQQRINPIKENIENVQLGGACDIRTRLTLEMDVAARDWDVTLRVQRWK